MKIIKIFFLYSIILCSFIYASSSTIEGTVLDYKTNKELIGANIIIENNSTVLGSASDENGYYTIKNIPIGTYTLKAMFIGYEIYQEQIRITSNQKYFIDISLVPSSIELQETTVTGQKRKEKITGAPASMEIVSSRDIKGKTTTNMGAYLKGLKGIDFTSSGVNNYSISVRGFNSSFNTRLLTLSDGRVANIPALRVINYSSIPQSMDDVDKIEVILGPATALYGANAHSGVVNIISKSPGQSEGFNMSISGSNDDRELKKINARYAKKLSKSISIKLSGLYLYANEWPYISEQEYKSHKYPWTLTPHRTADGKDNNPWNTKGDLMTMAWAVHDYDGDGIHTDSAYVRIGNGEKNHDDLDGDGVAGEDWYNGYDDDGDCPGDTNNDGCICCTGDSHVDEDYFTANGIDDDGDGFIDEEIDMAQDYGYDGVDNDKNGVIDDEAGNGYLEESIKYWGNNIENNILIKDGRKDSLIYDYCSRYIYDNEIECNDAGFIWIDKGEINPYYVSNNVWKNNDLKGNSRYNEETVKLEFDIYTYDFGLDGIPGDPFIDTQGDGMFQTGECLVNIGISGGNFDLANCDCGLDGICPDDIGYLGPDSDGTEGDGVWQPGDGWLDLNNNGEVDVYNINTCGDNCDGYIRPNDGNNYNDVWPPLNNIWDIGEIITGDCGQDNLCPGDEGYLLADPGENDGILIGKDIYEGDKIFDTGDGLFAFPGEKFEDINGNNVRDANEKYTDENGDGLYNAPDLIDNMQFVSDNNGDGLSDYPDFEIENRKFEFRIDYDPNPDFNLTFQSGYSWTKTQQVTGTGRYIADGFEYKFFQLRSRFKSWFSQFYINQSFSGNTRGYNLGNRILDKSKNYAFQIQNNLNFTYFNTKFVWGIDYFRTEPYTFGTILNDGPNGYDNDGDNIYVMNDNIDTDLDGEVDDLICPDGIGEGFRNNKYWKCGEGIDEPDEFIDPKTNEYGLYYQTSTELFGSSRYEFITAARLDYHDLLKEGIQFAPKLGFIYKPNEKSTMRLTYGKAFNTPNSITLFTDLFIGSISVFDIYLRGNKDGTPYCRVGQKCMGEDYPTSVSSPGFYNQDGTTFYNMGTANNPNYFNGYEERVMNAPYYFKFPADQSIISGDMTPLDTSHFLIFVPELNGEGVLYTPEESINIPDVDPIRTEKIQTIELGYKGFLGNKTHFSIDYYLSYYEDFFSPPTIITPWVVSRQFDENGVDITNTDNFNINGIMTINNFGTHPPYGTAWNGIDDDGDWNTWAQTFGWDQDDKNGDGNPADPGEWGFVLLKEDGSYAEPGEEQGHYHPYEALKNQDGLPSWKGGAGTILDELDGKYDAVGIDEWHETVGLAEYEPVQTGLIDGNGEPITGWGNANSPYHIVLSPMNYGEVWMQGCDFGFTHFLSNNFIIDGNVSWYGTTDFYNELTKKNDPINAPEWKWNASLKYTSKLGDLILNFRHVDAFEWRDGIWADIIGPYNILDLFYTYHITKNVDFNISALNLNDDRHKELAGGAIMGRQIIMRFSSTF